MKHLADVAICYFLNDYIQKNEHFFFDCHFFLSQQVLHIRVSFESINQNHENIATHSNHISNSSEMREFVY